MIDEMRTADEVRNLFTRIKEIEREQIIAGKSGDLARYARLSREKRDIRETINQKKNQLAARYRNQYRIL